MNAAMVKPMLSRPRSLARPRRKHLGAGPLSLRALSLVLVVGAWWLASASLDVGVLPGPLDTLRRLGEVIESPSFASNVGLTLTRVAIGMVATIVLATALGVSMGLNRTMERCFDVFILVGRSIPGLVWALFSVMAIGLNNTAAIVAVVLTATPLVVLQIWESTKALEKDLFQMARVFGVGRFRQVWSVALPALMPSLVAGTKLGLALAWQVVILAELFGLGSGVGYEIDQAFSNFDIAGVLAWTISFSVLMAIIEYGVIGQLQARLLRWNLKAKGR